MTPKPFSRVVRVDDEVKARLDELIQISGCKPKTYSAVLRQLLGLKAQPGRTLRKS